MSPRKTSAAPLVVFRHIVWEGPHRLLDAFDGVTVRIIDILGDPPEHEALPRQPRGVISMGGPMSANDVDLWPGLLVEERYLLEAVKSGIPVLGICLGAQILAKALGARVYPNTEPGVAPIEVIARDSLFDHLAPTCDVLHWHGDVLELPEGSTRLARSALTETQAFRFGTAAWGMVFHPRGRCRPGRELARGNGNGPGSRASPGAGVRGHVASRGRTNRRGTWAPRWCGLRTDLSRSGPTGDAVTASTVRSRPRR